MCDHAVQFGGHVEDSGRLRQLDTVKPRPGVLYLVDLYIQQHLALAVQQIGQSLIERRQTAGRRADGQGTQLRLHRRLLYAEHVLGQVAHVAELGRA